MLLIIILPTHALPSALGLNPRSQTHLKFPSSLTQRPFLQTPPCLHSSTSKNHHEIKKKGCCNIHSSLVVQDKRLKEFNSLLKTYYRLKNLRKLALSKLNFYIPRECWVIAKLTLTWKCRMLLRIFTHWNVNLRPLVKNSRQGLKVLNN